MTAAVATLSDARRRDAPRDHRAGRRPADGGLSARPSGRRGIKPSCRACPARSTSISGSIGRWRRWPTRNGGDAARADADAGAPARGVRAIPGGHWYVSSAHTDELVDETLDAFEDALTEL